MYIDIIDGKAHVSSQGFVLPTVQKVYKNDRTTGKGRFETWMRYVYFAYDKRSIYKNYLPNERERKVVEALFPDRSVEDFKKIKGMEALIEEYKSLSKTFREKLYDRLLKDIENEMDRLSTIQSQKEVKVNTNQYITFVSEKTKEEVTELVPFNVKIKVDNSEEKLKSMDIIDKLMKREKLLEEAKKKEQIEQDLKEASAKRLYDN